MLPAASELLTFILLLHEGPSFDNPASLIVLQFNRALAPTIPQQVQIIRGRIAGFGTASPSRLK